MELQKALEELRKQEKRQFAQSVDLIINLKGIDAKKDSISAIISLPHIIKERKVCAFLTKRSELVYTITPPEFVKYKDKKELKKIVKSFDFFIGSAKIMPAVATTFGKILGPAGKMPSPQLGVLMQEDDESIKSALAKIENAVKIRVKEPSIKIAVGKENMDDENIKENIHAFYQGVVAALPNKKENVKSILIKLTMGKPIEVEL